MFHYVVQKRIKIVGVLMFFIFLVIIIRIFYIEVFSQSRLDELANSLWSRNLPILADRGKITDRNGVVLADNITTTSLVVVPVQIKHKEEVAKNLASILNFIINLI